MTPPTWAIARNVDSDLLDPKEPELAGIILLNQSKKLG
jgi:hypothetical protein